MIENIDVEIEIFNEKLRDNGSEKLLKRFKSNLTLGVPPWVSLSRNNRIFIKSQQGVRPPYRFFYVDRTVQNIPDTDNNFTTRIT